MNTFHKVFVRDNWGHLEYTVNEEPFAPVGGSSLLVKWPDGDRDTVEVSVRHHTRTINDMGHSYTVDAKQYGFYYELHGVSVFIPIEKVKVRV